MIGLPDDGALLITIHDNVFGARPVKNIDADVYHRYEDGRLRAVSHASLDKALRNYPEANVTAKVVYAVVAVMIMAQTRYWNEDRSVSLHKALRINEVTYLFSSDILHAFAALAATGDLSAVLRYAEQTVEASTPVQVFRWVK